MTPTIKIGKSKYGNEYADDFVPTYTWEQAKQKEKEREEELAKKVKGGIEFKVMDGWHRLFTLSVEMYHNKLVPKFMKWVLYAVLFLALIRLGYYILH